MIIPRLKLLVDRREARKLLAQARARLGGHAELEVGGERARGIESGGLTPLAPRALPLLDRLEGAPHQPRLHALDPVATPLKLGQVFELVAPERVSRGRTDGPKFGAQGSVPLGIFPQRP